MIKSIKDEKRSASCCQHSSQRKHFNKKPRTVLVFGVFDLLHPGHHHFLQTAKKHGERLVVVVTRDERAEKEKGRRPVNNLVTRIGMLMSLPCVDRAVAGDKVGEWGMVRLIEPEVVCVGHDQNATHPKFLAQLEGLKSPPRIISLPPFARDKYSTTKIRKALFDKGEQ